MLKPLSRVWRRELLGNRLTMYCCSRAWEDLIAFKHTMLSSLSLTNIRWSVASRTKSNNSSKCFSLSSLEFCGKKGKTFVQRKSCFSKWKERALWIIVDFIPWAYRLLRRARLALSSRSHDQVTTLRTFSARSRSFEARNIRKHIEGFNCSSSPRRLASISFLNLNEISSLWRLLD